MPKINLPPDTPEGYKIADNIIYGKHKNYPGLFEIKLHNPKYRNAITLNMYTKLGDLIHMAEDDDDVKCILLHGGKYFCSGNDISMFTKYKNLSEAMDAMRHGVEVGMASLVMGVAACKKPLIAFVRGGCYGISFTTLGNATMVYCTPDAVFKTPFMDSAQSPEGVSTYVFPQIFGPKKANEILLTDAEISA